MVHEGTKRPSETSVARRIPNIWSNSENTVHGQKEQKSRKALRQREVSTSQSIAVKTSTQGYDVSTSISLA